MPSHKETKNLPYNTSQLFDVVSDIEKYPEFLPWVAALRITEENGDELLAETVVKFKAFTDSYTSRVKLQRPDEEGRASIEVTQEEGPFEYLNNSWKFEPDGEGSIVTFEIDFKFKSKLMDKMIGGIFKKAAFKMSEAFDKRAEELYG